MTVTEVAAYIVLVLTNAGSSGKWWFERRDARSALAEAKKVSDKTVETLTATVAAKNDEIAEKDKEILFLQHRVEHLETLLYTRGSG